MAEEKADFKLSREEAQSLREALKKEEFRKLLVEYAEEISDPENKRLYEEDIKRLEQERGVDVKFVHPTPGHVLKTSLLPSKKKVFINICSSDLIDPATPKEREAGSFGTMWSIPYSVTPPRDDVDKAHNRITIIDVVFNSNTYKKGVEIPKFNDLMEATTLDSIERDIKLKIDRKHVKRLKQPYKGTPHPAVIRKRTIQKNPERVGPLQVPYPPLKEDACLKKKKDATILTKQSNIKQPKHTVVYRGEFDSLDYTYERNNNTCKRPKEIVITVELPNLASAADLELDIHEKSVTLNDSKKEYDLKIPLSYPVDEEKSSAKFLKYNSSLIVTLPVQPGSIAVNNESEILPIIHHSTSSTGLSTAENMDQQSTTENLDKQPTATTTYTNNYSLSDSQNSPSSADTRNNHTSDRSQDVYFCTNTDGSTTAVEQPTTYAAQCEWKCPDFSFHQDNKIVSFVLHVNDVKHSTINSHYDENSAHLTFKGRASLCLFSFFVKFDSDCFIIPNKSFFQLSERNIVLSLTKCVEKLWHSFDVGINSTMTERKLFPTDNSLADIIHSVQYSDHWESVPNDNVSRLLSVDVHDDQSVVTLELSDNTAVECKDKDNVVPDSTINIIKPAFKNALVFDLD